MAHTRRYSWSLDRAGRRRDGGMAMGMEEEIFFSRQKGVQESSGRCSGRALGGRLVTLSG